MSHLKFKGAGFKTSSLMSSIICHDVAKRKLLLKSALDFYNVVNYSRIKPEKCLSSVGRPFNPHEHVPASPRGMFLTTGTNIHFKSKIN